MKIKAELSSAYQDLRESEEERVKISSKAAELNKDFNEVDEKMRKDEGRKIKIQEELDNMKKKKDNSLFNISSFKEQKIKLEEGTKEK